MGIDEKVAALDRERIDHRFKGLPPDADGLTFGELAAQRRNLFDGGFTTPVLALSEEALDHNLGLLERYTAEHGLAFAPHGKTSMAPQLFARQLAHGAWGITVAAPHQARVARAFGVRRIFVANEVVDAAGLRWIGGQLDADPDVSFVCYVDSVRGVELMDAALRAAGTRRPLDVVVELGAGEGARTGVRTEAEGTAVAEAVTAVPTLRLVGVAGYEGEVPDPGPASVRAWLRRLVGFAADLDKAGHFADAAEIVVSAGGSAWFDAVADVFAEIPELSSPALKLLRSGAYLTHDDDHYRRLTPFNRVPAEGRLEPAFRLWAQVLSRPTPTQAFLNAGKRDAPYDLGLPHPVAVRSARDGAVRDLEDGVAVAKLSDQHTWLSLPASEPLEVGDWVALGLSHPCTTFDKWRLIPVVREDGTATGYVHTFF
ncbi:D-serine deaminase, pyridoxal phosphate-dependent [Streptomyces sp. DvalAA-14]|uniref:amino acid deaminase n=1 Tax=unclassified Streptomyces TaxID=2593676 RepID=UPI00081B2154|nr:MULTISPECIES: amino acid deaminase [unclassified Streptomyces]MYS19839.1 amino acid deaminase [Streptomyces sp. SID4948]SCD54616.1 D-serine deaminase, pyridoxal phosphate-dependent [Streptomyces sp. DvalAA-14]